MRKPFTILISAIIILSLIVYIGPISPLSLISPAFASPLGFLGGPFGGRIEKVTGCDCIPNVGIPDLFLPYGNLIEVGEPAGGTFLVLDTPISLPGVSAVETKIFRHKKIEEKHWALGFSALPELPCYQVDKIKSAAASAISIALGGGPKLFCTDSKGEGPRATMIGTSKRPDRNIPIDFPGF